MVGVGGCVAEKLGLQFSCPDVLGPARPTPALLVGRAPATAPVTQVAALFRCVAIGF